MKDPEIPRYKKKAPKRKVPVYYRGSRKGKGFIYFMPKDWAVWGRYRDEATAKQAFEALSGKNSHDFFEYALTAP